MIPSPEEHKQAMRSSIIRLMEKASPGTDTSISGFILAGMAILMEQQPNFFDDVVDFHYKYGIQYQGPPRMLDPKVLKFREDTMDEELQEYKDAETLEDKIDALCDLIYFACGTAQLHGFSKFNEAWKRVHAKNMQKVLSDESNPGKRGAFGIDIVKPPGWTPPDHRDLIYHLKCVKCGNYDSGTKCHNCGGDLK